MFIFAVFGVSLFKNVKIRPGFDDVHNFQTFAKTFTLLFQVKYHNFTTPSFNRIGIYIIVWLGWVEHWKSFDKQFESVKFRTKTAIDLLHFFFLQICTSAGWSDALMAIGEESDCEEPDLQTGNSGDCGSYVTGTLYLVMYLVLTFLIIINMYIAVILENYSQVI